MRKTICMLVMIWVIVGSGSYLVSREVSREKEVLELEVVTTPTFKEVGEFWYVYMEFTNPRDKWLGNSEVSINELKKQGINSDWLVYIFDNWPDTPEGELRWKRGVALPGKIDVTPPLKITWIGKFKALTYTIPNFTMADVPKGNKLMDDYIKEKGYKHVWPIYEVVRHKTKEFHFWYLVEE